MFKNGCKAKNTIGKKESNNKSRSLKQQIEEWRLGLLN
jgi:hypothetical protein